MKYNAPLRARIREIAMTRVRYGFWRIYVLLRREGKRRGVFKSTMAVSLSPKLSTNGPMTTG
ncbi:hypothetical protein SAMN05443144_1102 [Fodinibius roseus]|uniref:Uncharacterized protein n=1 Tax=Fodinibius roseus TaxID=1194090 RepID=A0A1M5CJC5_9BACT|nr:hypothetical protein [Fodinibius roseus]SHF54865.1 hypothetical protein SAMN05443144_1102 [Fodinibius roseus]